MIYYFDIKVFAPEALVIEMLDDEDKSMYIVTKGECVVSFDDKLDIEVDLSASLKRANDNRLEQGDSFGEISMIYGCNRTANVLSKKFTTLGRLT